MDHKTCISCKETLPASEFVERKRKSLKGREVCKDCDKSLSEWRRIFNKMDAERSKIHIHIRPGNPK